MATITITTVRQFDPNGRDAGLHSVRLSDHVTLPVTSVRLAETAIMLLASAVVDVDRGDHGGPDYMTHDGRGATVITRDGTVYTFAVEE